MRDPARLSEALAAERARTNARIAALEREFDTIAAAAAADPPDDEHDPEGATIAFERQQVAALLGDARRRLDELDSAQARVVAGAYGVCERCGGPVGPERLAVRPAARTCVTCAGR
jgi:DnaK suppressor protein